MAKHELARELSNAVSQALAEMSEGEEEEEEVTNTTSVTHANGIKFAIPLPTEEMRSIKREMSNLAATPHILSRECSFKDKETSFKQSAADAKRTYDDLDDCDDMTGFSLKE
jgi:hypothetical protein